MPLQGIEPRHIKLQFIALPLSYKGYYKLIEGLEPIISDI